MKREHSSEERQLILPFCSMVGQNRPTGSKGPAPNTGYPKAHLPQAHNTLPLLPEGRGTAPSPRESQTPDTQEPSQKPFPRYQHEIQADCEERPGWPPLPASYTAPRWNAAVCCCFCQGLADRGLAICSPTLPPWSFQNGPQTCIPYISQQLAQFITI